MRNMSGFSHITHYVSRIMLHTTRVVSDASQETHSDSQKTHQDRKKCVRSKMVDLSFNLYLNSADRHFCAVIEISRLDD